MLPAASRREHRNLRKFRFSIRSLDPAKSLRGLRSLWVFSNLLYPRYVRRLHALLPLNQVELEDELPARQLVYVHARRKRGLMGKGCAVGRIRPSGIGYPEPRAYFGQKAHEAEVLGVVVGVAYAAHLCADLAPVLLGVGLRHGQEVRYEVARHEQVDFASQVRRDIQKGH